MTHAVSDFGIVASKDDPPVPVDKEINHAIEELHAGGGGVLHFPTGNYFVANPINLRGNVRLVGDGPACSKIRAIGDAFDDTSVTADWPVPTRAVIQLSPTSGAYAHGSGIEHMGIEGPRGGVRNTTVLWCKQPNEFCHVMNVGIRGFHRYGIFVEDADNFWLHSIELGAMHVEESQRGESPVRAGIALYSCGGIQVSRVTVNPSKGRLNTGFVAVDERGRAGSRPIVYSQVHIEGAKWGLRLVHGTHVVHGLDSYNLEQYKSATLFLEGNANVVGAGIVKTRQSDSPNHSVMVVNRNGNQVYRASDDVNTLLHASAKGDFVETM